MSSLQAFTEWAIAHPAILVLIWPVFTAFVTFLFRKHSADEYARLPAWLGHVMRFCEATGIDSGAVVTMFARLFGIIPPVALVKPEVKP